MCASHRACTSTCSYCACTGARSRTINIFINISDSRTTPSTCSCARARSRIYAIWSRIYAIWSRIYAIWSRIYAIWSRIYFCVCYW
jgi:hypothetical protein